MSAFFDTNILVYAVSTDRRRQRALDLLAGGGVISAQVLNEFTNVLRKKIVLEWPQVEAAVRLMRRRFPEIVPLTGDLHAAGLALARDHQLSFYDALIVAAAQEAGCETLFSEDLAHRQVFPARVAPPSLVVINPFAEDR